MDPGGVAVRPITEADIEGFRACLDGVARERRYLCMLEAPVPEKVREFVRGNIEKGTAQFVAVAGGRVVGWCDVVPREAEGFRHVGVLGIGVAAEHRRRGIGGRLLAATLEKARANGLEIVHLEVYASNAASVALYRRFGFVEEGRKRRGRKLDGRYNDVLLMALPLR